MARLLAAALLAVSLSLSTLGDAARADDIADLGNLGGLPMSTANGISGNGLVIVGSSNDAALNFQPYYWTAATGMVSLGDLGGNDGEAMAVNSDGSVIVGVSVNGAGDDEAFRWENGVITGLGSLVPGVNSMAMGVSADGSVVVGVSLNGGGNEEAFRWENGVMTGLGTIAGRTNSDTYGVSADGLVVVGAVYNAGNTNMLAYRWEGGVMSSLGTLGGLESYSNAANADGSVVVGASDNTAGNLEAFRWTQATGMVGLGTLGGLDSQANAVSADGSVVVGVSEDIDGLDAAFIWTDMGMTSITDMLIRSGVDMTNFYVAEATGVSADGSTISAIGATPASAFAGFLIRAGGITTADALNQSLGELSAVASDISYMAMGTMRGIMDQADHLPDPGTARLWLVGSLLGDTSIPGKDMGGEGGFGISLPLSDGLVLGSGLFMGRRSVDTKYGGSQVSNMFGPGAFLSYAPDPYGWRAKVGALYEQASLELNRGYPNGGGTAVANGSTEGHVFSLSGHLGYLHPLTPVLAVQPYVEYDLQATLLEGYTESDTPFPATFDQRRDFMNKARLGAELRCSRWENLDLWGWGAWSHRFDNKGPSMSGSLVGLTDFSYGGGAIDHDWAEVGGGVKYRPSERTELFSRVTFALDNDHYAAPDAALNTGVSWSF